MYDRLRTPHGLGATIYSGLSLIISPSKLHSTVGQGAAPMTTTVIAKLGVPGLAIMSVPSIRSSIAKGFVLTRGSIEGKAALIICK